MKIFQFVGSAVGSGSDRGYILVTGNGGQLGGNFSSIFPPKMLLIEVGRKCLTLFSMTTACLQLGSRRTEMLPVFTALAQARKLDWLWWKDAQLQGSSYQGLLSQVPVPCCLPCLNHWPKRLIVRQNATRDPGVSRPRSSYFRRRTSGRSTHFRYDDLWETVTFRMLMLL